MNKTTTKLFDNQIDAQQLLTAAELAAHLKVSDKTIYGWVYRGLIQPERLGPRLIRFSLQKVLADLRKGEQHGY